MTHHRWWTSDTIHALEKQLAEWWPNDDAVDWVVGDAKHALRKSDHNPDRTSTPPGVVRAVDVRIRDDVKHPHADDLAALAETAERLRVGEDARISYVIHKRRIFSSYRHAGTPAWTWRPYSHAAVMPHLTHVHVSVLPSGDHDPSPLRTDTLHRVAVEPLPVEGKPLTPEQVLAYVLSGVVYSDWPKPVVRRVQNLVGLTGAAVDGVVGPHTRKAVNRWVNARR